MLRMHTQTWTYLQRAINTYITETVLTAQQVTDILTSGSTYKSCCHSLTLSDAALLQTAWTCLSRFNWVRISRRTCCTSGRRCLFWRWRPSRRRTGSRTFCRPRCTGGTPAEERPEAGSRHTGQLLAVAFICVTDSAHCAVIDKPTLTNGAAQNGDVQLEDGRRIARCRYTFQKTNSGPQ